MRVHLSRGEGPGHRLITRCAVIIVVILFGVSLYMPQVSVAPRPTGGAPFLTSLLRFFVAEAEAAEGDFDPGIGGSVDVRAYTGSFNYSVPITLPPDRAGLNPQVTLSYVSNSQNGWVGLGWNITLGSIERSTKFGVPNYDDDDIFIARLQDAAFTLVKREEGGNEFRLKHEGAFSKIIKQGDSWEMTDKEGKKYYFGTTPDTKIEESPGNTFKWCLDRVEDVNGNYMTVSYTKDQGQIYPDQIDYTGHTGGLSPTHYVKFYLEDRSDQPIIYEGNVKVVTAKRLKTIEVYGNGQLARKYELSYTYGDSTGRSLLNSITQYGSDGVTSLPEVTVTYYKGDKGFEDQGTWIEGAYGAWDGSPERIRPMDVNGDGKGDIVIGPDTYGNWYVLLSTGSGFEDQGTWIEGAYGAWDASPERIRPMDVNGDGKSDIVIGPDIYGHWYVLQSTYPYADLLETVSNTLGATTSVEYTPSSAYENTYLPFVIQTVSSITTTDNMGHSATTSYTYEGGMYAPIPREFRGFNQVVKTDEVTGLVTETHHYQDQRFQSCVYLSETRDAAGALVVRTQNTWDASYYDDYDKGRAFAHIVSSTVTKYDDTGASLGAITTDNTYDEDYGNRLTEHKTTTGGYSRFTESQYLNDTTNWILGKPTNVAVRQSASSAVLRETRMDYTNDSRRLLEYKKRVHDGAEYTTQYQYDAYGNVTLITDPRSVQTLIEYDADGMFPIRTVADYNGLNHETEKTFDPRFGVVLTETDVNDQTTTYTYDVFGRETYVDYPDASWKETGYIIQTGNHHVIVRASDAPDATTFYDNLGRTIEEQTEAGGTLIATATQYDNAGRVSAKSLPFFSGGTAEYTTYEYDLRSRLIKQTNPDSTYRQIQYNGLQETIIDENNHSKTSIKDLLDRVTQVNEPTGGYAAYQYDIFDNLIGVQDPINNQTTITYDDLGRKIAMDDPYMGNWGYNYDEADNLTWQKNGRDQEVQLQYDALDRVLQKAYLTTNRQVVYVYDEPRSGYFNTGSLTTVAVTTETPQIRTEYNYDKMGQQVAETRNVDGTAYDFSRTYDLTGRITSVIYPGGTQVDYTYHPIGDLNEVIKNGSSTPLAVYTNYNAMGQVGHIAYGNDTTSTYTYYAKTYRIETMTSRDGSSAIIQDLAYAYDSVGNVQSITDSLNSVNQTFVYDEVDRLTQAQASTADPARAYNLTYTYDLGGNMLAKTDNNTSGMGWQVLEQDAVGRPTSIDYDTAIADIGERHVDYNQDNMPTRIEFKGDETNLVYDGENVRIKKVSASSTIIYIGGLYEIRDGAPVIHIFGSAQRIVAIEGTETYYYHTDHLSSTTVVTDGGGTKVEEMGYLPYGSLLYHNVFQGGQWSTVYRFTGQEYDAEYALYNYNARLYDPIMGRFISPDPVMQDYYNPQNLNRYTYCLNNPLIYVDPTGNYFGESIVNAIGGFFGGFWNGYTAWESRNFSPVSDGVEDRFYFNTMNYIYKGQADIGTTVVNNTLADAYNFVADTFNWGLRVHYNGRFDSDLEAAFFLATMNPEFGPALSNASRMGGALFNNLFLKRSSSISLADSYAGIRQASQYLKDMGVTRADRVRYLQSFEPQNMVVRKAGQSEFGLRFFSDPNRAGGQYLFETFPASRSSLALTPKMNIMSGFRQFQIRPGTTILEGRAASQGPYFPGGQIQKFILDWRSSLIAP